ncbi:hypothetical protein SISSUDRAFT_1067527 [Sistotremastrum suecicum HHB10207 ss-3]|uniref:Uncharacterized protein n=1 Tax=Sistotremastrum suecicum HHB10207 ss-3 TaxID=1314776 RepID=A0A165X0N7_9AGAM|nr:hypothetical protein SISSUDRAFT_1067527 [Sistotremastrum suecicum HHB10207 ss-3]
MPRLLYRTRASSSTPAILAATALSSSLPAAINYIHPTSLVITIPYPRPNSLSFATVSPNRISSHGIKIVSVKTRRCTKPPITDRRLPYDIALPHQHPPSIVIDIRTLRNQDRTVESCKWSTNVRLQPSSTPLIPRTTSHTIHLSIVRVITITSNLSCRAVHEIKIARTRVAYHDVLQLCRSTLTQREVENGLEIGHGQMDSEGQLLTTSASAHPSLLVSIVSRPPSLSHIHHPHHRRRQCPISTLLVFGADPCINFATSSQLSAKPRTSMRHAGMYSLLGGTFER